MVQMQFSFETCYLIETREVSLSFYLLIAGSGEVLDSCFSPRRLVWSQTQTFWIWIQFNDSISYSDKPLR